MLWLHMVVVVVVPIARGAVAVARLWLAAGGGGPGQVLRPLPRQLRELLRLQLRGGRERDRSAYLPAPSL